MNEPIVKIEKYPYGVKDDIDKLIFDILQEDEFTRTVLKNKVYEVVFKQFAKEELEDRLQKLISIGVIKLKDKEVKTKVLSTK